MLKRNYEIKIRLTKDEFEELNGNVQSSHKTREQYCRDVLGGIKPRAAPPVDYYTLICELRRVGTNLNQMLRVSNTTREVDVPALNRVIDSYYKTERMLWNAFAEKKD